MHLHALTARAGAAAHSGHGCWFRCVRSSVSCLFDFYSTPLVGTRANWTRRGGARPVPRRSGRLQGPWLPRFAPRAWTCRPPCIPALRGTRGRGSKTLEGHTQIFSPCNPWKGLPETRHLIKIHHADGAWATRTHARTAPHWCATGSGGSDGRCSVSWRTAACPVCWSAGGGFSSTCRGRYLTRRACKAARSAAVVFCVPLTAASGRAGRMVRRRRTSTSPSAAPLPAASPCS